jgi:hypothetical protein
MPHSLLDHNKITHEAATWLTTLKMAAAVSSEMLVHT